MTTIVRFAAVGAALGALTICWVGAWWLGRHRRAGGRSDVRTPEHVDRDAPDRRTGPDAVADRPEGGWSLDLTDEP